MEALSFLSKSKGIHGSIKNSPEDFIVEEIGLNGTILEVNKQLTSEGKEGEFTHFILQKNNWATSNAIKVIAKELRTSQRAFSYAGTKDKLALTTQLCSAYGISPERISALSIKDIQINGAWRGKEKVGLGDLLGNRFQIKIKDPEKNPDKKVEKIYEELGGKFPNYFGEQRFGTTRRNTHLVGECIIRNRFKEAVMKYLCDSEGEENKNAVFARKELANTLDFKKALQNFPIYLIHERALLVHLAKYPNDFVNSLRRLPRPILLLFVHAFQSHIFNLMISERIKDSRKDKSKIRRIPPGGILSVKLTSGGCEQFDIKKEDGEYFCGENSTCFPDLERKVTKGKKWLTVRIIGYETELNEREKELLERFYLRKEDFRIKGLPEISPKGSFRTFFSPLVGFNFKEDTFSFSLQAGSYATSALREFMKNELKK